MAYLDNFYFELHGDEAKPKLVFLHGLLGYASNWRKIITPLASQYHILVFDQRGHGKSFHPEHGYAPEDYAEDLHLILDELGWKQIFLVGHSMGGRNALAFALRFPHRVRGLVIEDITPSRAPGGMSRTEEMIKAVPTPFPTRTAAREFFQTEFLQIFGDRPNIRTVGLFFYSNMTETEEGTTWRVHLPGILESIRQGSARDRWGALGELAVPTLLVRGEFSDEVSPAEYKRMLESTPFIHGVEIPGAAHWVHADQPEAFTRVIEEFLAQVRTVAKGVL